MKFPLLHALALTLALTLAVASPAAEAEAASVLEYAEAKSLADRAAKPGWRPGN